jgi:MFS family permease
VGRTPSGQSPLDGNAVYHHAVAGGSYTEWGRIAYPPATAGGTDFALIPIHDSLSYGSPFFLTGVASYVCVICVICGLFFSTYKSARKTVLGLGKFIPLMAAAFGAGLIVFSFTRMLWLSMLLMVVTGLGFMVQMAASNTVLQTIVDEDKRGRVMSFYTMAFMGTAPFGSLLAGIVAERIGAPHTLLFGGLGVSWARSGLPVPSPPCAAMCAQSTSRSAFSPN